MVGTLRWPERHPFPALPPWDPTRAAAIRDASGWRAYLSARLGVVVRPSLDAAEFFPRSDCVHPSFLDGLSFPLSLVAALRALRWRPPWAGADARQGDSATPKVVRVLLAGASRKAEQRLVMHTDYFGEWRALFDGADAIHVALVGPEIDGPTVGAVDRLVFPPHPRLPTLGVACVRGTVAEFLGRFGAEWTRSPACSLVLGLNTGFGNLNRALRHSWGASLVALLDAGLLAVFTCANDFADLKGETTLWREVLGASVVLPPARNPFHGCTTMVAEGRRAGSAGEEEEDWSCANAFVYAVQGYADGRRGPRVPRGRVPDALATFDV